MSDFTVFHNWLVLKESARRKGGKKEGVGHLSLENAAGPLCKQRVQQVRKNQNICINVLPGGGDKRFEFHDMKVAQCSTEKNI